MLGPYIRQYGEATTINFALYEPNGVDFANVNFSAGDILITKDDLGGGNTSNLAFDNGNGSIYRLGLTATEMEAARIVITLIDQTATKAWLDTQIIIETEGDIAAQHTNGVVESGMAQGGNANTITFRAGASAVNDYFKGQLCVLTSGQGAGQSRPVIGYAGLAKIATISGTWATNPNSGTRYKLIPDAITEVNFPDIPDIVQGVFEEPEASHTTPGTYGVALTATKNDAANTRTLTDARLPLTLTPNGNIRSNIETVEDVDVVYDSVTKTWGPA